MFLKFGSVSGSRGFFASVALLVLVFTATTLTPLTASAEQSDEMIALKKKRRLKKQNDGSFVPSSTEKQTKSSRKRRISDDDDAGSSHGPAASNTKATTETEIVADQTVRPMLTDGSSELLVAALARYETIAVQGGWPKVPKGSYKKGAQSENIATLNRRLNLEGYVRAEAVEGEFAQTYTSATEDGVRRFQRNMGLFVTGQVDGPTIENLNVSVESRISAIRANIPRLSVYAENLGQRYVVVNVPAQQIETVNGGAVYSRHNAIVGRPERPTPVVMTALSDINFNPYWNAPPSIIERDIIPKMQSNTNILQQMNIKVFQGFGGPEIDPDTVNWRSAVADDYHFRQEPGGANAMATAKINFSSPFGIYLHDTPDRYLFKTGNRFYSSGCVRVEKVAVLLDWVLNGQDGIDNGRISGLAESLERVDVKLTSPPQLRVAYLTAWPAAGGSVAFRKDIYKLDGTGFTVGQPMPEGELSPEGQRYTLKLLPRQPSRVDADEAESFGIFGRAFRRSSDRTTVSATSRTIDEKNKPKSFFAKLDDDDRLTEKAKPLFGKSAKPDEKKDKRKSFFDRTEKTDKSKAKSKSFFARSDDENNDEKVKKSDKKKQASIFNFGDKKDKKKKPSTAFAWGAKKPKPEEASLKKPSDKKAKTIIAAKEKPDAKKAALKPDKTIKTASKDAAAKKPVVEKAKLKEPAKKVAVDCKPDAKGKLPAGCKV